MYGNFGTAAFRCRTNVISSIATGLVLVLCASLTPIGASAQGDDDASEAIEGNISQLNRSIAAQQNYISNLPKSIDPAAYAADKDYAARMDAYIAQETQRANNIIKQLQADISTLQNWQADHPGECPPVPSFCGLNRTPP
jgi:hypothetical protein